jgi:hypothetical protein
LEKPNGVKSFSPALIPTRRAEANEGGRTGAAPGAESKMTSTPKRLSHAGQNTGRGQTAIEFNPFRVDGFAME